MTTQTDRPLYEIAADIRADWKHVYYGARPYLDALDVLDRVTDIYGVESARWIVLYFLSNASTWKGPKAREIKAELRRMESAR